MISKMINPAVLSHDLRQLYLAYQELVAGDQRLLIEKQPMEDHMPQPEENTMKSERFINIRKLAALDIVFHRPKLILAEFAFGLGLCAVLSLWSFFSPIHSPLMIIIGCFFLGLALNYMPLLLYVMSIVRRKSAYQEVAFELAHKDLYVRKYMLQTFILLLVPLIPALLAVYQELHHRLRQER
jgi:hypothetical protein